MKTCVQLLGVTAVFVALSGAASAGEFRAVTSSYKTVTASSNAQVNAPAGDLMPPMRYEDRDPADGAYRTATSDAKFQWFPAFDGDTPTASTLKHNCNFAVDFSFVSDNDSYSRAGASFSNFPSDYQASFSGNGQQGGSIPPTAIQAETFNIGVPALTFDVSLGVGVKANTFISGFSASASSTAVIQTTSMVLVPQN